MTKDDDLTPAEVAKLADLIVRAVTGCPAVAAMADIRGAPIATYLAGRVVPGVAVRPEEVEVSVVARPGHTLLEVAAQVRQAVIPLVPGRAVNVVIGEPGPEQDKAGGP